MRLIYHPEAEAELAEAARFFEERSPGLGQRFLDEFDSAILEISGDPGLWPMIEKDLRARTMRRFPYTIYYRAGEDEIRILVIKHHSRHPDYWRHRLQDG